MPARWWRQRRRGSGGSMYWSTMPGWPRSARSWIRRWTTGTGSCASDVSGVVYATRAAMPHLLESKGNVVNVSSVSGLGGDWGLSFYNAAKGAVSNLTRALALEFGGRGVRVNAVAPSLTRSEMTADFTAKPDLMQKFAERLPLGRPAEPEEVASVIAFLSGPDASFVNGVVLPVDGGLSASNRATEPHGRLRPAWTISPSCRAFRPCCRSRRRGPAPEVLPPDPKRWAALVGAADRRVSCRRFDFFVVNVALPAMHSELGARPADLELVVAGYGLSFAVLLVTGGRLGDLYGRKRLFIHWHGGVHDRVRVLRAGAQPGHAHRLPGAAGADGGAAQPASAGHRARDLPRARACAGDRVFWDDAGAGLDRGAADRRRADPGGYLRAGLAADLPGQCPGGCRCAVLRRPHAPRVAGGGAADAPTRAGSCWPPPSSCCLPTRWWRATGLAGPHG